jgi:hypothetical protein
MECARYRSSNGDRDTGAMKMTMQPGGTRRFYTFIGLAMAAIVIVGFSRTFYLRGWFDVAPLTPRLHLHGVALTLWVVLFVVQTRLIAVGQRRLHMSLGVAGVALAAIACATTYAAAIEAVQLGVARGGIGVDRLYSSVLVLTLFASFVGLGAAFRKRAELHKAFMLLAMIAAIGPAVTRAVVFVLGLGIRDSHIFVESALVVSALFHHWQTRRRLHWVLLCGGVLLIALQATRRVVGGSEMWTQIGNWLIR